MTGRAGDQRTAHHHFPGIQLCRGPGKPAPVPGPAGQVAGPSHLSLGWSLVSLTNMHCLQPYLAGAREGHKWHQAVQTQTKTMLSCLLWRKIRG